MKEPRKLCECGHYKAQHYNGKGNCHGMNGPYFCQCTRFTIDHDNIHVEHRWNGNTQQIEYIVTHKGYCWITKSKEPYPTKEEIKRDFLDKDLRKKYFDPYYS